VSEAATIQSTFPPSPPDEVLPAAPPTEGIKYAGSKLRLLPHILRLAKKVGPETVFDGFAGTNCRGTRPAFLILEGYPCWLKLRLL